MKIGYLDPVSGASGDMLIAAAVDAGADLDAIVKTLDCLKLDGWALRADQVVRGGIAATSVVLLVADTDSPIVRTWGNVRHLLADAALPDRVKERSLATFQRMAEVEARLSRRPIAHVHFSEVGALDAVVDVVGACAALEQLAVESVVCGPVAQGVGMARGEHGLHPIPGPAVLELLAGAPTFSTDEPVELTTRTGAALLAEWTVAWGLMPPLVVERVGYGAGNRDLARPNVLRLVLGTTPARAGHVAAGSILLSAVGAVDAEAAVTMLRDRGALDAWAVPAGDGRFEVRCLCPPRRTTDLRARLSALDGFEVLWEQHVDRWPL